MCQGHRIAHCQNPGFLYAANGSSGVMGGEGTVGAVWVWDPSDMRRPGTIFPQ